MTDKTRSEMLVNLGDDASTALDNVGGKGANLGKLIKAGFPVPPGAVVGFAVYQLSPVGRRWADHSRKTLSHTEQLAGGQGDQQAAWPVEKPRARTDCKFI